jgi:hypothetical protein
MPAEYSVDLGRDSQNERENLKVGTQTLSQIVGRNGGDIDTHLNERASDYVKAKAVSAATGAPMEWLMNPAAAFPPPVAVQAAPDPNA